MADIVRISCRNYTSMTGTGRNGIAIEMYLCTHVARAGTKEVGTQIQRTWNIERRNQTKAVAKYIGSGVYVQTTRVFC